jgi:hypothetical protein
MLGGGAVCGRIADFILRLARDSTQTEMDTQPNDGIG